MSFIGFTIFYQRWMPWFEFKVAPIRKRIQDNPRYEKIADSEDYRKALKVYQYLRDFLLAAPILHPKSQHSIQTVLFETGFCIRRPGLRPLPTGRWCTILSSYEKRRQRI
jgi:hypothetical protein